ncbi:MAG TPA: glycosyltransferase, partial [Thermaerobacter sp.]
RAEIEAAMEGDGRIRPVLEHVPDGDIQLYMNAADAVVMPYEEIFTSGTVVLAMSFGRAVVAPRQGCLAEVVDGEGGILYDPADPAGLEGALRRALAADLAAMGRHNRERAAHWDWDTIARMTRDAYAG